MLNILRLDDTAPVDTECLAAAAAGLRAHRDEWLARRLYARMQRRPVLFRRPVPLQIRHLISTLLEREGKVLSVLTSGRGGRQASMAAITGWPWYRSCESLEIPGMQPLHYSIFWPSKPRSLRAGPEVGSGPPTSIHPPTPAGVPRKRASARGVTPRRASHGRQKY